MRRICLILLVGLLLLTGCGSSNDLMPAIAVENVTTNNVLPATPHTGSVGTTDVPWAVVNADSFNINGTVITDIANITGPQGVPGINGTNATATYLAGDYGLEWAEIALPQGENGQLVIASNTNSTGEQRLYTYANGTWQYSLLINPANVPAVDIGLVSTNSILVRINGVNYKIPLALVP